MRDLPLARGAPRAPLSAEDIEAHPGLPTCIRAQARALSSIQERHPRIAAIFATQQRWLLAHIALSIHFRAVAHRAADDLRASVFIAAAQTHGVASRNTADAFMKEMLKYGYVEPVASGADRRVRSVVVAEFAVQTLAAWLVVHLTTLDALDDGRRREAFLADPARLADIQPRIADDLLSSVAIRDPTPSFSLFTWLNEGGVVMDWLCAGLADAPPDAQRIPTNVASLADIGQRIRLSRSQLYRKLRIAESMGSLGWSGEKGNSSMWVSAAFLSEYYAQQSAKLAIIDRAFHEPGSV
jgi:hypothetical protein